MFIEHLECAARAAGCRERDERTLLVLTLFVGETRAQYKNRGIASIFSLLTVLTHFKTRNKKSQVKKKTHKVLKMSVTGMFKEVLHKY